MRQERAHHRWGAQPSPFVLTAEDAESHGGNFSSLRPLRLLLTAEDAESRGGNFFLCALCVCITAEDTESRGGNF